MTTPHTEAAKTQTLKRLAVLALVMFGFSYAMVPFYQKLCQVTGITDLLRADTSPVNTQIDTTRWVTLEFDGNAHGLPWRFAPMQRSVRVHPGEMTHVVFEVSNDGSKSIVGQAIPSYGPKHAAEFVKKLECFCFKQQVLAAGEKREMPVQFVVDTALPKSVDTLTLSYTFFEVQGGNLKPAVPAGKSG